MTQNIDLSSLQEFQGFKISGAAAGDESGASVSTAGDINNDGYVDVIISAHGADPNSRSNAGASYVIYGGNTNSNVDIELANIGTRGFAIYGAVAEDQSSTSVSTAGDVNNDGYDDIIIGAPFVDPLSRINAGTTYIIYGNNTNSNTNIDLNNLGTRGFAIYGAAADDRSGIAVRNAGDVNNDGYDDVIIGALYASPNAKSNAGITYVIYGGSTSSNTNIDLASLGTRGFAIYGAAALDDSGVSVSTAGDINNDNYDDIIIGAWGADPNGRNGAGVVYVIYGGATSGNSNIDLANLGTRGFLIMGAAVRDDCGSSVASAGDINNDSYDDIIIGAYSADPNSRSSAGISYVIYGGSTDSNTNIDLASLANRGFAIYGAVVEDRNGVSVSGARDLNKDGYDDIIIGAYDADPNSRIGAGISYVIYGGSTDSNTNIDLANLGNRGFAIYGAAEGDKSGYSVAFAGDINHDSYHDLIIGARWASPNSKTNAGISYIIYGAASGFVTPTPTASPTATPTIVPTVVPSANPTHIPTADPSMIPTAAPTFSPTLIPTPKPTISPTIAPKVLNLSNLTPSQGFKISGDKGGDRLGFAVSSAGDINNDTYPDILIKSTNAAFIIYGATSGFQDIQISDINAVSIKGFSIRDDNDPNSFFGYSLKGAGDVNWRWHR